MEDRFGRIVIAVVPVVLSREFFWICGVLSVFVGLARAYRKREPWLWRGGMFILAASFFGWPIVYSFLGKHDLQGAWIFVLAATFITFQAGATLAFVANREPEGTLGRWRSAVKSSASDDTDTLIPHVERRLDVSWNKSAVLALLGSKALPALQGEWNGRDSDVEVALSLLQNGAALEGVGTITTTARSATFRITGELRSPTDVEIHLEEGDDHLGFVGRLEGNTLMRGRLQGVGFPARNVVLSKSV